MKNNAFSFALMRRFASAFPLPCALSFPLTLLPLVLLAQTGCVPKGVANGIGGGAANATSGSTIQNAGLERSTAASTRFVDVAQKAGLDYRWSISGKRPLTILQTIGNGCAFLDFDNDGNLDILLVGSRVALYKGDGQGHFVDVSAAAGVAKLHGRFLGCAVGDYDGDGYPDVYLTAYRGGALLHNDGRKGFSDKTQQAHIAVQPWATSAAWADVDGNGTLDLFIANYVDYTPDTMPQLCDQQGFKTSCGPAHYHPEKSILYLNDGKGLFRDGTKEWGIGKSNGKTLGAAFAPLDSSSPAPSLYLSNDEMPGDLMHNKGKKFENVGTESGSAYDLNGNVHGGMGLDWGDFDNDGRLDLFVSTFRQEPKCIYHNDGELLFNEQSARLGIETATAPWVAFGVKWLDFDNDGWLDLVIANGHVQDNISQIDKAVVYRQTPQLLHSEAGTHFSEVSGEAGPDFKKQMVGRGLATGDFDNDGRVDVLIVDSEGQPLLMHNECTNTTNGKPTNWAGFRLVGKGAEGALVTVAAGGQKRTRLCTTGGSYMSASDSRVHVGLGAAEAVETVSVRWADGKSQSWNAPPVNAYTTLTRK